MEPSQSCHLEGKLSLRILDLSVRVVLLAPVTWHIFSQLPNDAKRHMEQVNSDLHIHGGTGFSWQYPVAPQAAVGEALSQKPRLVSKSGSVGPSDIESVL